MTVAKSSIKLFEIPIYLYSEKDYNERWEAKHRRESIVKANIASNGKPIVSFLMEFIRFRNISRSHYRTKSIWKYNQIIGYIVVAVNGSDIEFNIYHHNNKKTPFNHKMLFIEESHSSYFHYNFQNLKSQNGLKDEIRKHVNWCVQSFAKSPRFVDLDYFERVLDSVDFNKLIEKSNKEIVDFSINDMYPKMRLDEVVSEALYISLDSARDEIEKGNIKILSIIHPLDFFVEKPQVEQRTCKDIGKIISTEDTILIANKDLIIFEGNCFGRDGFSRLSHNNK